MSTSRETRGKAKQEELSHEHESESKKQKVETRGRGSKGGKKQQGKHVDGDVDMEVGEEQQQPGNGAAIGVDEVVDQFEEFVDELKEQCSFEDLKAIAVENGITSNLPPRMLLLALADQFFYGPLQMCPMCDAHGKHALLICDGHHYKCSGFISEWTMCNYISRDAQRTNGSLKLPKKLTNDFLKQYEKTQDASNRPTRVLASGKKPFLGMAIALSGRLNRTQGAYKADIAKYGGKVANAVKEGVTCLIAGRLDAQGGGGSAKTAEALEKGVPIVREEWISHCIKQEESLPLETYDLSKHMPGESDIPWDKMSPSEEAAESLMAVLKLVGKRGVYKDTKLEEQGGKIFESQGIIYNCAFSMCDMVAGINDYAIIQLIQLPSDVLYLYYKKGRVGDRLHNSERLDEMDSHRSAVKEFLKLFEILTGNAFEPWEREKKFRKKPMKFFPIDMAPGIDARAGGLGVHQLGAAAAHTKVEPHVAQDLKVLMSQEVYRFAMLEMGVDAPDLPTGNLTEFHLQRCADELHKFAAYLRKPAADELEHERMCLDMSNKWWSLVHTTRPFVISDIETLAETAAPTLESLKAISVASQLIGDLTGATQDDPLADRYAKLGCQITPLDHGGEDFKMILNYLSKTMEPVAYNDTQFNVTLQEACQIDSPVAPTLKDLEKMSNKILIWCGTRTSNLLACMKLGMPPAVIQAPVSGYMFGEGLYCSDSAARAAQYGFTAVHRPEGYLILAVVALGDEIVELTEPPEDVSDYKKKHVAIKGLGRKTTNEKEYIKWHNDITVPCGSLIESGSKDSPLEYNEYCVFNPKQVKPHYLLRIRYE